MSAPNSDDEGEEYDPTIKEVEDDEVEDEEVEEEGAEEDKDVLNHLLNDDGPVDESDASEGEDLFDGEFEQYVLVFVILHACIFLNLVFFCSTEIMNSILQKINMMKQIWMKMNTQTWTLMYFIYF